MSLKQEIETWVQALAHYDNNEFEEALAAFGNISDTARILFNCGVIHATLGEHDKAVECFQRSVRLDQYFAVAYFQQGVSNFLVGDFEEALANFNDTLLYLRGNNYIDYEQLGLKFKLYSCEVLFNRGLCYMYLQQEMPGMSDFEYARKEKMTPDHDVIDDAIRERAEGYTVFSIPVGVVYRPNDAKVKNLKTKDYLGKARLVAASEKSNAFTGFTGSELKAKLAVSSPQIGSDERPSDGLPFATSSLVDRTLSSRGRQQSEPPMSRNVFPPTPPPEADKLPMIGSDNGQPKGGMTGRAASVRNVNGRAPQPGSVQRANTGFARDDNGFSQGADIPPLRINNRPIPPTKDAQRPMDGRGNARGEGDDRLGALPNTQYGSPNGQQGGPSSMGGMNGAERPRLGTMRTASEPRGPSRQYPSMRNRETSNSRRPGLYREMTDEGQDQGRGMGMDPYNPQEEYRDELYDMYSSPRMSRNQGNGGQGGVRRTRSYMQSGRGNNYGIPEEPMGGENDVYASDAYSDASLDEDFDMVSNRPPQRTRSRRPADIKKIRVKVHADEDTRYIMVGSDIRMEDFETKIQEKFKLRTKVNIKVADDGDMVTMGDQDDLDVVLSAAKMAARKNGDAMGKMEVWVGG